MNIKEAYDLVNMDQAIFLHGQKIDIMWERLQMDQYLREVQKQQEQLTEKIVIDTANLPEQKKESKKDEIKIVENSPLDIAKKLMKMN